MKLARWIAMIILIVAAAACASTDTPPTATLPSARSPTTTPLPTETPLPTTTPSPTPGSSGQTWKLVWADEFDYTGLPDSSKWDYEVGYIRNNELQYYTRARQENARVKDGMLIIEARKEPYAGYGYTSASLITYGKASWRYGRVEVSARLPTGNGMWPAIWMLGMNIGAAGWPACGEIDIMENVGFEPDRIYGNIHTTAYNHVKKTGKGANIQVSSPYNEFHVYAVEWFADRIDFFVDDQKYFTFKNEDAGNDVWPYDKELYLILNIAVGGSWGGMNGVDDRVFPQQFTIDYVRVYQADQ